MTHAAISGVCFAAVGFFTPRLNAGQLYSITMRLSRREAKPHDGNESLRLSLRFYLSKICPHSRVVVLPDLLGGAGVVVDADGVNGAVEVSTSSNSANI